MPQSSADTWVYLIWVEHTQLFKIGRTQRDPEKRFRDIRLANPFPVQLIDARRGNFELEKQLHHWLRRCRVHGEWFALPEEIVWGFFRWFGHEIPEGVPVTEIPFG